VPCVQATPTDFVITGSIDGHIKFWKKQETGIEFVKHYRGHLGAVDGEHQEGQLHTCITAFLLKQCCMLPVLLLPLTSLALIICLLFWQLRTICLAAAAAAAMVHIAGACSL